MIPRDARQRRHRAGSRSEPAETPKPPAGANPAAANAWIWGWHAVLAALANPERKILRFVATAEAARSLAAAPVSHDAPSPQVLERDALQRLLPTGAVHQGLALLSKPLPSVGLDASIERWSAAADGILIALDQVSDPHNVGAVMRSAAAFGACALIVTDRHAPEISGTLAKAASGAVEYLPLIRVVNLARALDQLKQAGWWIVGLTGDAEHAMASFGLSGKIVLVLGSEGEGLRRLIREACDMVARLPTAGPVASLNVSNAAAIALYELRRI